MKLNEGRNYLSRLARSAFVLVMIGALTFVALTSDAQEQPPVGKSVIRGGGATGGSSTGALVNVEVSRIGDATHIEFNGLSEWKYKLERAGKGPNDPVVLRLPGLTQEALAKIKGYTDPLLKSVQVNEKSTDEMTEISFAIGVGQDFFDYVTDQPSRLIVDFFPMENKKTEPAAKAQTVAPVKSERAPAADAGKTKKIAPPPSVRQVSSDDEGAEDDQEQGEESAASEGVTTSDGHIVAKSHLPEAPSLAEQISSRPGFRFGMFDGGDPEFLRFSIKDYEVRKEAIAASRGNYYLHFPMLQLGFPQLDNLLSVPPAYEIVPAETRENKEARVLLKMFKEGKRALFLKASDEFLRSRADSPYDEMIRYMVADAHYDIYRGSNSTADFDSAMIKYLALTEKYPESPLTQRTLLLMGYSYLYRSDSFGALKTFQRFERLYPQSKYIDRVRISSAESYLKLNRFDDAFAMFERIEKTGQTARIREEGAFRKGDVLFRKKDYAGAIREYKTAIKKFPKAADRLPNAWYNIAEAEFELGKFREGLDSYRTFVQKFPAHEHGGYAMTRIGELLAILGAPKGRSDGAYMESYFRYRSTPGAGIARIRMLTERMPVMNDKEVASAIAEVKSITKKYFNEFRPEEKQEAEEAIHQETAVASSAENSEGGGAGGEHGGGAAEGAKAHSDHASSAPSGPLERLIPVAGEEPTKARPVLEGIDAFSTFVVADGHNRRRDYDQAATDLMTYYTANPSSPNREKLKSHILRNLIDGLNYANEKGEFIDALRRYAKHANGWFKGSDRVDLACGVARAYEQAGVYKEAEEGYSDCLKKLNVSKVPHGVANPERDVFEKSPSEDHVNLRLAGVAAKADQFARAEAYLKKIGTPKNGNQSPFESLSEAEQVEKAELLAQVAEARGQSDSARKYLTALVNGWRGDVRATSPLLLRLARLDGKAKNFKSAELHLKKVIGWRGEDSTGVSDDLYAQALEMRADHLMARGKKVEAVAALREYLQVFESKRNLESARYRLGQLLYQQGDLKGAEAAWAELKADDKNLWRRLATEQMQGARWQNEYKKYLQRIPAAADMGGAAGAFTEKTR